DRDAPYSVRWNNPQCGFYNLIAKAHDACGNEAEATLSRVQVCTDCAIFTQPPSFDTFTAEQAGVNFQTFNLAATVRDDLAVRSVAFAASVDKGVSFTPIGKPIESPGPYTTTWKSPVCGENLNAVFRAIATDTCGKETTATLSRTYNCVFPVPF